MVSGRIKKLPGGSLFADKVAKRSVAGAKADPKKGVKLGKFLASNSGGLP